MALNYLRDKTPGVRAWNLGTGKGSTVFHMIKAFEQACGKSLNYEVVARRPGDVLDLTANPARANEELGWKAELTIEDACTDMWRWTENNPRGYCQDPPKKLVEKAQAQAARLVTGKSEPVENGSPAENGRRAEKCRRVENRHVTANGHASSENGYPVEKSHSAINGHGQKANGGDSARWV